MSSVSHCAWPGVWPRPLVPTGAVAGKGCGVKSLRSIYHAVNGDRSTPEAVHSHVVVSVYHASGTLATRATHAAALVALALAGVQRVVNKQKAVVPIHALVQHGARTSTERR